jgi:hypothetical protein
LAFFEAATITSIVTATANTPIAALRAITRPCRVFEIGLSAITAPTTSGNLGLVRSTALGTGGLTGVFGQPVDIGNSATASTEELITAWASTAPTINATYLRRFAFPASVGVAVIWTWPPGRELVIPGGAGATSELVIANLTATAPGTWQIYVAYEA